ncbi:hypothetical protein RN001_006788 [Aquatica leii]|uniref:U6 snRNA-associated Sm-like protein LSm1 n=1 Tax=Aquatica leii TaxID=1421715 RepID=A0AAN7SK19_9COLE|nr:hypothetical protein RN001_006788 [Aquatica leii]
MNRPELEGTAHLLDELDKKLMVVLRDGRTLIGYLRSVDQFANLVLHKTIERIHVGKEYGDIPRGVFIVRGENVVLLGEIDTQKEANLPLTQVTVDDILDAQRREQESKQDQQRIRVVLNKMPGGARRLPRTVRSTIHPAVVPLVSGDMASSKYSPIGSSSSLPGVDQPPSPKHFPFPITPMDSDLVFELIMFIYTTLAAGLQFLQLYRSVWWLPHSYNNNSVNFYLIDMNLVTFIVIILSRRLVYVLGCRILEKWLPDNLFKTASLCYRMFLFGVMVSTLSWCAYYIIQNHTIVNIFYLCYPISVYIILFGFTIVPFFELVSCNPDGVPPLHACTSTAAEIRSEVESLKSNFNGRMKQILFNSVLNAYYAGLLPCCFAQSFVYYDINWATQHTAFLWLSCFVSYSNHVLPLRYCDILHRSALHLGYWDKVETRSHLPVTHTWQEDVLWPFGSLVRHGRDIYRGLGEINVAEPGNTTYARFFTIFWNPSIMLAGLLAVHVALVLFQLTLLLRSYYYWYNTLSITSLLCFNYYTLFKIGTDYLISQKIYKFEQAMHDKLSDK